MTEETKKPRGLAKWIADGRIADVRALARRGGLAAREQGRAYSFPKGEKAREAGRKGGLAVQAKRRAAKEIDKTDDGGCHE